VDFLLFFKSVDFSLILLFFFQNLTVKI